MSIKPPIKPLQRIVVENNEDGTQVSRLPNVQEVMSKINEIVEFINKNERQKDIDFNFKPKKMY